jgi:hypothetical protein
MMSCHGYAACRDGMPTSKLSPEKFDKKSAEQFPNDNGPFSGRASKTKPRVAVAEGISRKKSQEMFIRRLDFPAHHPVRNYSPRPRTAFLNEI